MFKLRQGCLWSVAGVSPLKNNYIYWTRHVRCPPLQAIRSVRPPQIAPLCWKIFKDLIFSFKWCKLSLFRVVFSGAPVHYGRMRLLWTKMSLSLVTVLSHKLVYKYQFSYSFLGDLESCFCPYIHLVRVIYFERLQNIRRFDRPRDYSATSVGRSIK